MKSGDWPVWYHFLMDEEVLKKWSEKFDECLALEFSDPAYFKVHHILVATFMLHTGRYTPAYKSTAISLLKEFLSSPSTLPTKERIDAINSTLASDTRHDNIFTKERGDILDTKETILDVDTRNAERYCESVMDWAHAVVLRADEAHDDPLA